MIGVEQLHVEDRTHGMEPVNKSFPSTNLAFAVPNLRLFYVSKRVFRLDRFPLDPFRSVSFDVGTVPMCFQ